MGGPDGARHQSRRRFKTLQEAIAFHAGTTSDRARGTHVAPTAKTVRQAVDEWLAAQRIRPNTHSAYVSALRPAVDHLGDRPVQTITKTDIEKVVAALRDGTSKVGDWHAAEKSPKLAKTVRGPWSAASINKFISRTSAVFDDLVEQGVLVRNVVTLVKPIPKTKTEIRTLSAEHVSHLLEATVDDPMHVGWRLALFGLRRGEVLALRWDSIDFHSGTLSVTSSRLATAGGPTIAAPKTDSSNRTLPLTDDLAAALRRERIRQDRTQTLLGSKWPESGLVVVDELGYPPHPDTFSHRWSRMLVDCGLPRVRLHGARHTCATLMHMSNVPAAVIAAWLGHTDSIFTLSVYTHSTGIELTKAARTLNQVFTAAGAVQQSIA